jgi:3-oxoacyl-[acyl-carrier protein] reductase
MTEPTHRTAIVTSASRGIGSAIARRLAADGIAAAVHYGRSRDEAEALVRGIKAEGGRAIAAQSDLAEPDAMSKLFDAAEDAFGIVDILVNNGGVMNLSPIADTTDDAFERQVAVNLGGTFRGMRAAANRIADNGRIISFSSSVVGLYQPGYGVYAATKAAVEAMTHVLAKELGPRGITVNVIAPGPVETELFLTGKSQEQVKSIADMNPFGRLGAPDDIARVTAFLASAEAGWVNGQTIRANGGII